jgi:hypothetical protein
MRREEKGWALRAIENIEQTRIDSKLSDSRVAHASYSLPSLSCPRTAHPIHTKPELPHAHAGCTRKIPRMYMVPYDPEVPHGARRVGVSRAKICSHDPGIEKASPPFNHPRLAQKEIGQSLSRRGLSERELSWSVAREILETVFLSAVSLIAARGLGGQERQKD